MLSCFFDSFNPMKALNGERPRLRTAARRRLVDVEGEGDRNFPENAALLEDFKSKGGKLEDDYFKSSRNLKLFSRTLVPENPRGAVVVCHSYCSSLRYRHKKAMLLYALRGYVVTGVELEGHGWSDGLHGCIKDFNALVDDVDEFVLQQQKRFSDLSFLVHGESLGGCVALHLAFRAQDRGTPFNGAVLVAPMCVLGEDLVRGGTKINALNVIARLFPTLTLTPAKPKPHSAYKDAEIFAGLLKDPVHYHGMMRLATAREFFKATLYVEDRRADLETPFCVMHGTGDLAVPVEGIRLLYEKTTKIPAEDKKMVIIEDGWHGFLWAEEGREANWLTLLDWASSRLD